MEPVSKAFRSAENWLDERGPKAWIIAFVLGFIFVWPIGLAILLYALWSNKMSRRSCRTRSWSRDSRFAPTGNVAFDAYREETLKRLEDEQAAFQAFLEKLRKAKDQAEFDQFMDDRRRRPAPKADAEEAQMASNPRDEGGAAPMPA
ncbi:MAG: DUF2852 domain-containing protein [Pseudomonadota bacterium]